MTHIRGIHEVTSIENNKQGKYFVFELKVI